MTYLHSRKILFAALLLGAAGSATQGVAHHAFAAEFDSAKPVAIQGVVTKARFVNPHSWIYLDVKNKDGSVTSWGFEFGTPSSLRTNGLSKEDVRAGTPIRVAGYRAKNGGPFGYAAIITLADGRKVQTGSAPDAPTAPARR
ncbi:DUF6152 family protein [Sphingobium cupriresistens]|uniref:DUF5666 domain-containing protein n=1 Tax=Sphingobium cupriresistens TaxID=1132417 RepID=A0A8G1ZCY3_9SPHN|nr:DUF6152 family protein [Sphingobium cupriresistens]RYM06469.1 hypothetical protein EWH12_20105 [Sphingobium cupriresistens]